MTLYEFGYYYYYYYYYFTIITTTTGEYLFCFV